MSSVAITQVVALTNLLLAQLTNNVDVAGVETKRVVDRDIFAGTITSLNKNSVVLLEVSEELRLVTQGISGEAISKADQTLGEVVHGEPGDHLPQLHAGPPRHVDDQVAQVLPVSEPYLSL